MSEEEDKNEPAAKQRTLLESNLEAIEKQAKSEGWGGLADDATTSDAVSKVEGLIKDELMSDDDGPHHTQRLSKLQRVRDGLCDGSFSPEDVDELTMDDEPCHVSAPVSAPEPEQVHVPDSFEPMQANTSHADEKQPEKHGNGNADVEASAGVSPLRKYYANDDDNVEQEKNDVKVSTDVDYANRSNDEVEALADADLGVLDENAKPIDMAKFHESAMKLKDESAKAREKRLQKASKHGDKKPHVNPFARIWHGIGNVVHEVHLITWPKGKELAKMSVAVIVCMVVLCAMVLLVDAGGSKLMEWLYSLRP